MVCRLKLLGTKISWSYRLLIWFGPRWNRSGRCKALFCSKRQFSRELKTVFFGPISPGTHRDRICLPKGLLYTQEVTDTSRYECTTVPRPKTGNAFLLLRDLFSNFFCKRQRRQKKLGSSINSLYFGRMFKEE